MVRRFFDSGETISGSSYYFTKDHLGSVREMTNSSGSVVWQQSFDAFGVPATIVGTTPADFGFAGMYVHTRSGLNLTLFREYSSPLGRWLSRDPLAQPKISFSEMLPEVQAWLRGVKPDANKYMYVRNNPAMFVDPFGLFFMPPLPPLPPAPRPVPVPKPVPTPKPKPLPPNVHGIHPPPPGEPGAPGDLYDCYDWCAARNMTIEDLLDCYAWCDEHYCPDPD